MTAIRRIIEGLQLIEKYHDGEGDVAFEHDIIYAGPEFGFDDEGDHIETDPKMPPDAVQRMDELGWFVDSEFYCWAHY
jgi:hypothetical protein